ncbi:MAG: DinB family protein, partial [Planctomycetota bacterium]
MAHTQPPPQLSAADTIRRLHDHRLWTRAKILAAARSCTDSELRRPFEMGVGSLFGTIVHLFGAEMVWANVLEEADPATTIPAADSWPSVDALDAAWRPLDARWARLLERASDLAFLARPMPRVRDGKT